jgi:hypothetical protein
MGSSPKVLITHAVEPQLPPQQTPEIRSRRKSILSNNPFKLSDLFLWNATTVSGKKNTTIRSMNKDRGSTVIHIALGAVGGRVYRLVFLDGWTLWTPNQRKLRCLRQEFRNPITTLSSSRTHHNLTKTPNMIDSRFTMNTCRWKKVLFLRLSTLVNKSQKPHLSYQIGSWRSMCVVAVIEAVIT